MRLPIDPNRSSLLVIGEPAPKLEFNSQVPKTNRDGVPLWTISVLMSGTGERQDPSINITVASQDRPLVHKGDVVVPRNLTARTWSLRDAQGRERNGVAFEADGLESAPKSK